MNIAGLGLFLCEMGSFFSGCLSLTYDEVSVNVLGKLRPSCSSYPLTTKSGFCSLLCSRYPTAALRQMGAFFFSCSKESGPRYSRAARAAQGSIFFLPPSIVCDSVPYETMTTAWALCPCLGQLPKGRAKGQKTCEN